MAGGKIKKFRFIDSVEELGGHGHMALQGLNKKEMNMCTAARASSSVYSKTVTPLLKLVPQARFTLDQPTFGALLFRTLPCTLA